MQQSTIALIIMLLTIILFATEKLPLAVTAILSAFAMAATGCITYSEAFSGFSNTATIMVIGLCIIGEAFFTTGLADKIGNAFLKMNNLTERKFVLAASIASTILSGLLNGLVCIALFLPIIDSLAARTNGKIRRKTAYLPVAIGSVFGGNLSSIGSSSMINASGQLGDSYFGRPLNFFEPFWMGLGGCLIFVVLLALLGTKLQDRFFDFEEVSAEVSDLVKNQQAEIAEAKAQPVWKQWFVVIVLALCLLSFILGKDFGAFSMLGACVLIIFKCIDMKHAIHGTSWDTVLVVAGTLGFAKGVQVSGAGKVIADTILGVAGPVANNAFLMACIFLFLATLISNFMSNNATVAILVPVALSIAQALGANPVPFVLCCGIGANLSVMTPICTATITMTVSCGYRFKDYVKFGGIFNVLAYIFTALAMKIVYF